MNYIETIGTPICLNELPGLILCDNLSSWCENTFLDKLTDMIFIDNLSNLSDIALRNDRILSK